MAKNINVFKCMGCNDGKELSFDEFKTHLYEVHGIDIEKTNFSRHMMTHIDGARFYQSQYKLTFESGLVAIQHCYNTRTKNDPMYY